MARGDRLARYLEDFFDSQYGRRLVLRLLYEDRDFTIAAMKAVLGTRAEMISDGQSQTTNNYAPIFQFLNQLSPADVRHYAETGELSHKAYLKLLPDGNPNGG